MDYQYEEGSVLSWQKRQLEQTERERKMLERKLKEKMAELEERERQNNSASHAVEANIQEMLQKNSALKRELTNLYGSRAKDKALDFYGGQSSSYQGDRPLLLESLLAARTKEFSQKQQDLLLHTRQLNEERQQLLVARDKLMDKRRHLVQRTKTSPSSESSYHADLDWHQNGETGVEKHRSHIESSAPPGGQPENYDGGAPEDVSSFIRQTKEALPGQMKKYKLLREQHERKRAYLSNSYHGELGVHSYSPWQLEHYHMVRSIIEDEVAKFLDVYFPPIPPALDKKTALAMLEEDVKEVERRKLALQESRSIQLIADQILLEVTGSLARDTCEEILILHQFLKGNINKMFMDVVEGEERSPEAGTHLKYDLVTKTFFDAQAERNLHRKEIWAHSQYLDLKGPQANLEVPEDEGVRVLCFHHLVPVDMSTRGPGNIGGASEGEIGGASEAVAEEVYQEYNNTHKKYWKKMSATSQVISLSKRTQGIEIAKYSKNCRYLALGAKHGDVIIYNTGVEPWQPVRAIYNSNSGSDPIVDISWSLDSTGLITVTQQGQLYLWSLDSAGVSREEAKLLELKVEAANGFPSQPTMLHGMDTDENDFTFSLGEFAETGVQTSVQPPSLAAFHPSLTFLGKQHGVCVALDGGDILKLDLEEQVLPPTYPYDTSRPAHRITQPQIGVGSVNTVGEGEVQAELFRGHKHMILYMGFLQHTGHMVTVDIRAHIYTWIYHKSKICSYGWFEPDRRYRLHMNKNVYVPSTSVKPTIVFSDKAQGMKTRQDMARERRSVESQLEKLSLREPWHEDTLPAQDLKTGIYAPPGVEIGESGAIFHVVRRVISTGQISGYATRLYKPVKVRASRLLCCKATPGQDSIIFILLFPQYTPKEAHLTLVVLDLISMELTGLRKDIILTDKQYQVLLNDNSIWCDVSQVMPHTGAAYVFVNIAGSLHGYCLLTGTEILRTAQSNRQLQGFMGCVVNLQGLVIEPWSKVVVKSSTGKLTMILYSTGQKKPCLTVITLRNSSRPEDKENMWSAYKKQWKYRRSSQDVQQSAALGVPASSGHLSDTGDDHPAVYMRRVVLACMDTAIQQQSGQDFTVDQREAHREIDRKNNYQHIHRCS